MAKPTSDRRWAFDTLAIHAGQAPDPQSGAVMPPIVLASTFAHERLGAHRGFEYGRTGNPTRNTLEACLAALEGGSEALAFGSGCAAITALLQTLRPGDHVVACDDVYGGTFRLLDKVFGPLGVVTSWVDMTDLDNVRAALRDDTALVSLMLANNDTGTLQPVAELARLVLERDERRGGVARGPVQVGRHGEVLLSGREAVRCGGGKRDRRAGILRRSPSPDPREGEDERVRRSQGRTVIG